MSTIDLYCFSVMNETSFLQREIQQSRPFRSRSQETTLALFRTADLLRRRFAAVMEAEGVTFQQYNVLRILRGADEPLPTLTIAERMVEKAPGVTRMLDRLESKGWVRRERCAQDRRQVLCSITTEGLERLDVLQAPVDRLDDTCMAMLGQQEQQDLVRFLDEIRRGNPDD